MAGETIILEGTPIAAVTGAANSVANGAFNNAADKASITNVQVADYPYLKLELRMTFNGTGTLVDAGSIDIYVRRTGAEGQAPEPSLTYEKDYVGGFSSNSQNATTEQNLVRESIGAPIGGDFEIWIKNSSGKDSATGWDLVVTPYTYTAAT